MANIVPLFDPDAPLRGKAREAAVVGYRATVEELVERSMHELFTACCRLPEGQDLGINDALPIIEAAMQRFSRF
jgi:hypothetical protein